MENESALASPIVETPKVAYKSSGSGVKFAEARRRLPINVFSNTFWLFLHTITSMWYTPYLIKRLGVAAYGLVPLANSVTAYLSVLTAGFDSAIGRFLTIDLARNDTKAANRTFNTAFMGSVAVLEILSPVVFLISWLAPQIFNMPLGYERDAQWLVFLSALAFMLTTFSSSFAVSSYAYYRFDLRLVVNVIRLTAQMASIVLLFLAFSPQLWHVGMGIFLSSLILFVGYWLLWRKLTPQLEVRPKWFDLSLLKKMLTFGGWILVNQLGAMLFLNIDLIIANRVFGPEVAGRYGSVLVLPSSLRALVSTIDGVLVPIVLTLYAQKNRSRLVLFSRFSVKLMGLIVALPIGLLCGLSKPFLTLWLGAEFADLSWLLFVLISHLCVSLAVVPLFSLQVATGNVKIPGLVSLLSGCGSALLAFVLARWSGLGYIGIAVAGAIMLILKNGLFTPLYGAHILALPRFTFLPSLFGGALGTLFVAAGGYLCSVRCAPMSWGGLALAALFLSLVYLVAVFFVGLSAEDRALLKDELERRLRQYVNE